MCFEHPMYIFFFSIFCISVSFRQLCCAFRGEMSTLFQTRRGRVATFFIPSRSRNVHFSSRINATFQIASLPRVVHFFHTIRFSLATG